MSYEPADASRSGSAAPYWSGAGLTTFVGRDQDIDQLGELLLDPAVRLVTLTGPGGVGKTRLAEVAAARLANLFPDGVLFVEFAAVADASLFASAILRALGGEQEPAAADVDSLVARLQTRSLLLILDNLEQLLSAASSIQQILVQCPGITCLVTSRALLQIRGEFEYSVEPLTSAGDDSSPAVQLLRDRTRAAVPAGRSLNLDADIAARICDRVDGLPLAIELAAAQLRILTPEELLRRLEGSRALAALGPRDLPSRQATMESTVAWSFDLLPPDLQSHLSRLAVFTGGFSLESAQILLGHDSDSETIDVLQALVANSLVRTTERNNTTRFSMLETIRAYGLSRLAVLEQERSVRDRHAQLFCQMAERDGPRLRSETDEQLRVWLGIESDIANYRSAVDWMTGQGNLIDAAALVSALDWFWTDSNYVAEGLRLIEPLGNSAQLHSDPVLRARTLRVQSTLVDMLGHVDQLDGLVNQALEAAELAGTKESLAELHHLATGYLIDKGEYGPARAMARRTIASAEELDQAWFIGAGELNLALVEVLDGDPKAAIEATGRAHTAYQACGDRDLDQSATLGHALALLVQGDYAQAQEIYQSVLASHLQRLDEAFFFQQISRGIAAVVTRTGSPETAARIFGISDAERERTGITLRKPLQSLFETYRDDVRQALNDAGYQEAWSGGYALAKFEALTELIDLAAPPRPLDRKSRPSPLNLLSNREYEVLQYLVAGKTDPEIAHALFLSPRTVSQHVSNILSKLNVSSRTAAAALAARTIKA